jgi:hypothetical protein
MAIPDFQSIMLPMLQVLSDGKEWSASAVREELARRKCYGLELLTAATSRICVTTSFTLREAAMRRDVAAHRATRVALIIETEG